MPRSYFATISISIIAKARLIELLMLCFTIFSGAKTKRKFFELRIQ